VCRYHRATDAIADVDPDLIADEYADHTTNIRMQQIDQKVMRETQVFGVLLRAGLRRERGILRGGQTSNL
jgi:hypothetical protein